MGGGEERDLKGRVAAVLGVGPGLGTALARRFTREGFAAALMARSEESVADAASGLQTVRQMADQQGEATT